jgi:hypothetical protein
MVHVNLKQDTRLWRFLFTRSGTGDAQIGIPYAAVCRGVSVRCAERVNGSINQINASITGTTNKEAGHNFDRGPFGECMLLRFRKLGSARITVNKKNTSRKR